MVAQNTLSAYQGKQGMYEENNQTRQLPTMETNVSKGSNYQFRSIRAHLGMSYPLILVPCGSPTFLHYISSEEKQVLFKMSLPT